MYQCQHRRSLRKTGKELKEREGEKSLQIRGFVIHDVNEMIFFSIKVNINVLDININIKNTCHLSDWRINQSKRINISQVYVTTVQQASQRNMC